MTFFSDDQASELRELFFESTSENLQALNEEGLQLEQHPGDAEVVRRVRRTVHTVKGDSAAVGFTAISEVAHELEDALTPAVAERQGARLAEVVFAAADLFTDMLSAYRQGNTPPSGDAVLRMVRTLASAPASAAAPATVSAKAPSRFVWNEYERMVMFEAASQGRKVLQVSMALDPQCAIKAAALQMVKNALNELGMILAFSPDESSSVDSADAFEAAISSSFDRETIIRKCKIPSLIADVAVTPFVVHAEAPADTILELDDVAPDVPEPVALEEVHAASASTQATTHENTLRVNAARVDAVLNLVGELIIGKSMLTQTLNEFSKRFPKDTLRSKFSDALAFQVRVMNDLQKAVMKVRMVPVDQLFRRFPRMVRDVSKACGKEVELVMQGQDTDLDKSILDILAEPLAHLVRNAVGHGIESTDDRIAAGKDPRGTIGLNAYHQGNQVVIEVSDDGNGIDRAKLAAKAFELGLVTTDELGRMNEYEVLQLIFHPGLSTADQVTNISGRGVGMDVVKTVLDRLKGNVTIDTTPGKGTKFYLRVPLTLAIIKALLFRAANRLYAIPLATVVEITRAHETDIHMVDNCEVLKLRDKVITLVRLSRLPGNALVRGKKLFVVVVSVGERTYGLAVDNMVGEEELVIKAIDDNLVATELVSGASILGDGTVVLILNTPAVVARFSKAEIASAPATPTPTPKASVPSTPADWRAGA